MGFLENIKNFFNHLMEDISNYSNQLIENPNTSYIIILVLVVVAGIIILWREVWFIFISNNYIYFKWVVYYITKKYCIIQKNYLTV